MSEELILTVDPEVELIEVGEPGPPGPLGSLAATEPLTVDGDHDPHSLTAARTVALAYGAGLAIAIGALVVDTTVIATRAYADSVVVGYVPASRQVIPGAGLSGGGALSGDVTLDVVAGTGISVAGDQVSVVYGTGAATACVGNDARLSDARTPSTAGTNGGAMVYAGSAWASTAAAASGGMSLLAAATPSNAPAFGWSNRLGDGSAAVTLQGATFAVTGSVGSGTTALWDITNGASTPYNASSGTQVHASLTATINQSGTAAFNLLALSLTKTSSGSGARNLLKASVGGVAKWTLDDTGAVVQSGGVDATGQIICRAGGTAIIATGGAFNSQVTGSAAAPNFSLSTGTGFYGQAAVSASVSVNSAQKASWDTTTTAGNTAMLLWCVDTGAVSRVKTGADGTGPGGTGRALYV